MKYSDIEEAFLFVSAAPAFEHEAYLNKETGEAYYVSALGDSDELPDDLDENEKYVSVPHKNDLNLGRDLVFDFVSADLPAEAGRVRGFFNRAGAYARFKDLLESKGLLEAWCGNGDPCMVREKLHQLGGVRILASHSSNC